MNAADGVMKAAGNWTKRRVTRTLSYAA